MQSAMRTITSSEKQERTLQNKDVTRLLALFMEVGRRRSLRDPIASACEDLQITAPQIHAVGWLGVDESLTMGELARRLCISEKTATGIIDRLQAAGTVTRERDPNDRRVIRVRLTPEGESLSAEIHLHISAMLERVLYLLDAPRRDALFDIMETLLQRMEQEAVSATDATDHS